MITLEATKSALAAPGIHKTLFELYGDPDSGGQYFGYQLELPEVGNPKIYLYLEEGASIVAAQSLLNTHGMLPVSSDKATVLADGSDTAVITATGAVLASDSAVTYTVWLDGEIYTAPSSTPVTAGQAQLTLNTETPGEYLIEIKRQGTGKFESGYITINAQEVS